MKKVKYIILFFIVFSSISGIAQHRYENLPRFDKKRVRFGFLLGFENLNFRLKTNDDFAKQDTVFSMNPESSPGFQIGIYSCLKILPNNLDLRFVPSITFGNRGINYGIRTPKSEIFYVTKSIEATTVNFPLDLKFITLRLTNARGYLLAGTQYSVDIIQKKKKENDNLDEYHLKTEKSDFSYSFGGGFEFYLTLFKLTTEAKVSFGVNDLLQHDNTVYTRYINSLKSRTFQISFIFE